MTAARKKVFVVRVGFTDGEQDEFPFSTETGARMFLDRVKARKDVSSASMKGASRREDQKNR